MSKVFFGRRVIKKKKDSARKLGDPCLQGKERILKKEKHPPIIFKKNNRLVGLFVLQVQNTGLSQKF